jgi:hypothetical protein
MDKKITNLAFAGDVDNFASRVRDIVVSATNGPILDAVTSLKLRSEKCRRRHDEHPYLIIGHFTLTSAGSGLVKRWVMMFAT